MEKILIENGKLGKDTNAYKKLHPSLNDAKIRVSYIILERVDGPSAECNIPVTVKSWKKANETLRTWSATTPAQSTDKVDFVVVFRNCRVHRGTYELSGSPENNADLAVYILRYLYAYSSIDQYRELLNNYQIGD